MKEFLQELNSELEPTEFKKEVMGRWETMGETRRPDQGDGI